MNQNTVIQQDQIKDELEEALKSVNRLAFLLLPPKPKILEKLQEIGGLID